MVDASISNTLRAACLEQLKGAVSETTGVEFMILATSDGYAICDTIPPHARVDAKRLGAMAASFAGISDGLAQQTGKNQSHGSIIETDTGVVVCRHIKSTRYELVLLGSYARSSNHGIALWSLNNVARDIQSVIETYS
jgi:predicted regulator of Ras-like GTPase activity (Roadblock/LC7/MglB family)